MTTSRAIAIPDLHLPAFGSTSTILTSLAGATLSVLALLLAGLGARKRKPEVQQ